MGITRETLTQIPENSKEKPGHGPEPSATPKYYGHVAARTESFRGVMVDFKDQGEPCGQIPRREPALSRLNLEGKETIASSILSLVCEAREESVSRNGCPGNWCGIVSFTGSSSHTKISVRPSV